MLESVQVVYQSVGCSLLDLGKFTLHQTHHLRWHHINSLVSSCLHEVHTEKANIKADLLLVKGAISFKFNIIEKYSLPFFQTWFNYIK